MVRTFAELLLLGAFAATSLSAQGPASAVSGTVLDPHQAYVSGARVTLEPVNGSEARSTSADSRGAFRFEAVAPGDYEVQIEQPGFKSSLFRVRVGNQSPRALTVILSLADVR